MINKLKKKISIIILITIAIPLLILVILYNYSYYNSIVRSSTMFIDRFNDNKREIDLDKKDIPLVEKKIPDREFDISNIDGVYSLLIVNGEIVNDTEVSDEIKEVALKVATIGKDEGIIDAYTYSKRRQITNDNGIEIILVEDIDAIKNIYLVVFISILTYIIALILIYILAKKIAALIAKPVDDAFNKQKDFISDASHELKTPLAVIQANADVLENEIGNNKWLKYIQNETDNMSKLINDLLLLAKTENFDDLKITEEYNISEQVELIVASFESMAFEKGVKVITDIQDKIVSDKFNQDDIQHILSTLIDNAIKHTDKGKKVIIELKKDKDNLIIIVKNEGELIPESEKDKIFERFYRVDKARNRSEKRYGLGLAIAKSIVIKNKGIISVDSSNGLTKFRVNLPF